MGLPSENPIWWRLNVPLSLPPRLVVERVGGRASGHYGRTRKRCHGRRSCPTSWPRSRSPPVARPNCAEKFEVRTENSWTASSGTFCPMPAPNSSLLAEPSSRMLVLDDRWPLIA